MDNCEGYRGLRDLASLLRERSELTETNYYDLVATNAASGILSQTFNVAGAAFTPSDANLTPEVAFYPGSTCQIYPQAFGLTELAPKFDTAWAYLNRTTPGQACELPIVRCGHDWLRRRFQRGLCARRERLCV
jgi:hypothetical protein